MTVKNDSWIINMGSSLIHPFESEQVNPASYDLRISHQYINLTTGEHFSTRNLRMIPGTAYLASTIEQIKMPMDVAATVFLKSSLARQGLDHALAGWVDPNFKGTLTMELHAHREIVIYAGQRIMQIVFQTMSARASKPYVGRYQHQSGPTEAIDDPVLTVPNVLIIPKPEKKETEARKIIKSMSDTHASTLNGEELRKRYQMGFD